jgi:hypothetical protein
MTQRTPVPEHIQEVEPMATEKQSSYMEALRDGKDLTSLTPQQQAWLKDADFTKVPKRRASDIIAVLKALDWQQAEHSGVNISVDVADGRYAIPKDDGTLMFYSVKQGKYIKFVDVWASDARYPVKNPQERKRILEAIEADADAGPRFGREIGRCYVCGRTLTDETSRSLGIGPVCRGES